MSHQLYAVDAADNAPIRAGDTDIKQALQFLSLNPVPGNTSQTKQVGHTGHGRRQGLIEADNYNIEHFRHAAPRCVTFRIKCGYIDD